MKIHYKGVIDKYSEAEIQLPDDAVKYIDPETMEREGKGIAFYSIMAMMIPIIIFSVKYVIIKETPFMFSILGVVIGCVILLPHEYLHGLCFPMNHDVEMYQMIKPPRMFVSSTKPLSKSRYIFICIFPNLIFGLIPLLIWLFISPYTYFARTIFAIGFISIVTGGRDYMNIIKTVGRVPPFSQIQISGTKLYYLR